ncbi:MAG: T9SS type A sorting domain-containing protein [Parabacteroides sp.]|nr:T9SS type A sorting domain-containing protein [Parabacteroides sp.]
MKTKYKQWLRPLFLSLLWLLIGSPVVWGQSYTINLSSQSNILPEKVDTVYIQDGVARELFIPELKLNDGSNSNYQWYVRWYLESGESINGKFKTTEVTIGDVNEGGTATPGKHKGALKNTTDGKSLVWYDKLYVEKELKSTATGASTVSYKASKVVDDVVICDVSMNQVTSSTSGNIVTITEPTLSKRYKFVIRNATIIADRIKAANGEGIETYELFAPKNRVGVNIQMKTAPNNYSWYDGSTMKTGTKFCYVVSNNSSKTLQEGKQVISIGTINNRTVVKVYPDNTSNPLLATFIINPLEDAGFMLQEQVAEATDSRRKPTEYGYLYQEVGSADFDMNNRTSELMTDNNIYGSPLNTVTEPDKTNYAFLDPQLTRRTDDKYTALQNQYGLYRSANVKDVSTNDVKGYFWFTSLRGGTPAGTAIYDLTYYNTARREFGLFYYIDASNEPGRLVKLKLDGTLCAGTELIVNAWVNDMTTADDDKSNGKPLPPNININFIGVKEGTETVLHRFTSGDALTSYNSSEKTSDGEDINSNIGKWQQLCYSFTVDPQKYDITAYDDFYVEVQNNAAHTYGADYAIDDVRVYKTLPKVEAFQADFCEDNASISSYLKLRAPFEQLLRNIGLTELNEATKIVTDSDESNNLAETSNGEYSHGWHPRHYHMYYTVTYKEHDTWKYLGLDYHSNPHKGGSDNTKDKDALYGTSVISANFIDMPTQAPEDRTQSIAWTEVVDGVKYIVFDSIPIHKHTYQATDGTTREFETLELGRDYFIQIFPQLGESSGRDTPDEPCAIATKFTVHKSLELKYGEVQLEDVTILEPGNTITGVLRYQDKQSLEWTTVPNAEFDWYYGPTAGMPEGEDITSMLKKLREDKRITTIQGLESASGDNDNIVSFFKTNKDYLKLGESSFTIPANPIYQLTVVPVITDDLVDENINLCYEGRTLTFDPVLDPGDPEVDYPEPDDPDPNTPGDEPTPENPDPDPKDPEDPQPDEDPKNPGRYVRSVRLMLTQIQDMLSSTDNQGTLRIPIHTRVTSVGRTFKVNPNNNVIRLVRTSDEEAHKLNHPLEEVGAGIRIATLESLVIPTEKEDDKNQMKGDPAWDTDYFTIKFDPSIINGVSSTNDIEFREGFWYMVEVPFIECPIDYEPLVTSASTEGTDEESSVYEGSFKLTFKVVPEYVTWKGSEANMHNWNNDGPKHWRRSKNNELYFDGTTTNAEANGNHEEAYTPMRFTKVTVADNGGSAYAAYPYLYKLNLKSGGGESNTKLLDMAPAGMPTDIGRATTNIEYDLVADPDYQKILWNENNKYEGENIKDNDYACVRFYGNTCDEIYFKPQSAMLHTEYLTYNKAWVDYELDPNRWYTLASPLKGIVAGDMYLPKSARQETAAFADITYNTTNYTRWDPAVYMRGWNKAGEEKVVTKEGSGIQYAISGSWSNLYNKVSEPFTAGTGFSIGVKPNNKEATTESEKVLFRLPKADTEYTYYASGDVEGTTHDNLSAVIENGKRKDYGQLFTNDLEATGNTVSIGNGNYQLVGNPFMAHLDMTKFGTYYILTEKGIETSVLGESFSLTTNADSDPKKVAPLQSFIVSGSTSVTFTPDMMTVPYDNTGITSGLRSATSENEQLPEIRISLEQEGKKNTAVVAYYATATEGYAPNEDALLFIDKEVGTPQIYTVAGNKMTAINVTPELKDLPLGVYSADNTPVTLNFQVSGAMGNVSLYDRETKKSYPLTGGLTITVEGNTSGRYFLRGSVATSNEIVAKKEAICYSGAPGRIDVIHSALLQQVAVYSLSGQRVRFLDNLNTPTLTIDGITPGIYVVRMEGTTGVQTEKVEVK